MTVSSTILSPSVLVRVSRGRKFIVLWILNEGHKWFVAFLSKATYLELRNWKGCGFCGLPMYESDLLVYKNTLTLTLTLKQNGALNRRLVLSFLSCHTLLPDIRNEMSKITLYCMTKNVRQLQTRDVFHKTPSTEQHKVWEQLSKPRDFVSSCVIDCGS